jgi:hypothetical protein
MDWLTENLFWIVVVVVFFLAHTKMHAGHRGHGGCGSHESEQPDEQPRSKR